MKNKLQSLIRQAINEVLNEDNALVTTKKGIKTIPFKNPTELAGLQADSNVSSIETTSGTKLKETELNEMAGIRYKLAPDYESKMENLPPAWLKSDARMRWINGVIDHLNDVGEDEVTKIALKKFKVPQARLSDYTRAMIKAGVMEPAKAGVVPKFMQTKSEEDEEEVDPLAQYFDGKPNNDGSEDFPSEEEVEPEIPATREPIRLSSPVMKAAEFTTDDANDRLIQRIISTYSSSRIRVKEVNDSGELSGSDFAKSEKRRKETATDELDRLIQQLVDKIKMEDTETQAAILNILAKKFASAGYAVLSKKVAKAMEMAEPEIQTSEPEIDDLGMEDDEEDIEPLEEYAKRKLQYYAGIIK